MMELRNAFVKYNNTYLDLPANKQNRKMGWTLKALIIGPKLHPNKNIERTGALMIFLAIYIREQCVAFHR